jgi:hypothetical protein
MAETNIITWNAANQITISLMFLVMVFAVAVLIKVFATWQPSTPAGA